MSSGSLSVLPTLDAPPGEPSSSKKSTFAGCSRATCPAGRPRRRSPRPGTPVRRHRSRRTRRDGCRASGHPRRCSRRDIPRCMPCRGRRRTARRSRKSLRSSGRLSVLVSQSVQNLVCRSCCDATWVGRRVVLRRRRPGGTGRLPGSATSSAIWSASTTRVAVIDTRDRRGHGCRSTESRSPSWCQPSTRRRPRAGGDRRTRLAGGRVGPSSAAGCCGPNQRLHRAGQLGAAAAAAGSSPRRAARGGARSGTPSAGCRCTSSPATGPAAARRRRWPSADVPRRRATCTCWPDGLRRTRRPMIRRSRSPICPTQDWLARCDYRGRRVPPAARDLLVRHARVGFACDPPRRRPWRDRARDGRRRLARGHRASTSIRQLADRAWPRADHARTVAVGDRAHGATHSYLQVAATTSAARRALPRAWATGTTTTTGTARSEPPRLGHSDCPTTSKLLVISFDDQLKAQEFLLAAVRLQKNERPPAARRRLRPPRRGRQLARPRDDRHHAGPGRAGRRRLGTAARHPVRRADRRSGRRSGDRRRRRAVRQAASTPASRTRPSPSCARPCRPAAPRLALLVSHVSLADLQRELARFPGAALVETDLPPAAVMAVQEALTEANRAPFTDSAS